MLNMVDLEKCVQLNISAPNNDMRTQAENQLKELKKKNPQIWFEGISQLIMKSNDINVRSFCGVLLKQNLGMFDDTFFKLPINSQNNIKQLLLQCIENEQNQNVTTQIAEAISRLTCLILQNGSTNNNNKNNKWNELIPFLFSLLQTKDKNENKIINFYICIDKLATNCIDLLRSTNNIMEKLKDILINGLQSKKGPIGEYALSAIIAILCSLNDENELLYFNNIVPLLFQNLNNNNNNNKIISKTCDMLQTLAESQPNFFISSINPIIECLVNVTQSSNLEWDTRRLSMNLLITLLDYNCNEIALSSIGNKVIPLCFDFLSTFNEDLEWNTPNDDCEQINYIFGQEILPIIVSIFGADIFLNIIQQPILNNLNNSNEWKKQLIALKTIEITIEGCIEHYEPKLFNIVASIIELLNNGSNNNKYIKYAALLLIKQLSVIFCEDKQIFFIPYHNKLMLSFIQLLNTASNEHICVIIALNEAIAHFVYMDDDDDIILQYSDQILAGLFNLLNSNNNLIQCYSLKAISVIISVIQHGFHQQMYKQLMKKCIYLLQEIFSNQNQNMKDETGELRGRCMECIGQMLVVTDIDICRSDAHNIMKYLLPFQKQEQMNPESESYTYMLSLFASCAEALTREFTPYLQHIIPSLLQSASKQSIKVGKKLDDSNCSDSNQNQTIEFGGIRMQINTAEFNERSTAVKQLPRYAVCMEGELLQFVKPISKVLSSIIKTRSLSSEARRYAIETFAPLVNCLKCGLIKKNLKMDEINKWVTQFTQELLLSLIDSMNISDEVDEFSLICKTITNLFTNYISASQFTNVSIINDITEQLAVAMNERQERQKINLEKSIDLIDEQIEIDVEADLSDTIVDLISILVCKFGDKYIQIFEKYLNQQCIHLLNCDAKNDENDQILSYGILTEIIRYSNSGSKYTQYILQKSQKYLSNTGNNNQSPSASLLQSISYAIGVIAIKKGLNINNLSQWINLLKNNIIEKQNSRNDDNIAATENAISAIGKICKAYENNNQFIIEWIQMLPIINDNEEREFCNSYLLQILKNTSLLKGIVEGNNSQMIEKLIQIIAVGIVNNDMQEKEFKQLFAHVKSKCNQNIVNQAINNLENHLKNAFAKQ